MIYSYIKKMNHLSSLKSKRKTVEGRRVDDPLFLCTTVIVLVHTSTQLQHLTVCLGLCCQDKYSGPELSIEIGQKGKGTLLFCIDIHTYFLSTLRGKHHYCAFFHTWGKSDTERLSNLPRPLQLSAWISEVYTRKKQDPDY